VLRRQTAIPGREATCISCYLVHIVVMSYCYNKIRIRVSLLKLSTPTALTVTANRITSSETKNVGCCFESSLFFEPPAIHPRSLKTKKIEINVLKVIIAPSAVFGHFSIPRRVSISWHRDISILTIAPLLPINID